MREPDLSTDELRKLMTDTLNKPGVVARNDGDALKVIAADATRVEKVFTRVERVTPAQWRRLARAA